MLRITFQSVNLSLHFSVRKVKYSLFCEKSEIFTHMIVPHLRIFVDFQFLANTKTSCCECSTQDIGSTYICMRPREAQVQDFLRSCIPKHTRLFIRAWIDGCVWADRSGNASFARSQQHTKSNETIDTRRIEDNYSFLWPNILRFSYKVETKKFWHKTARGGNRAQIEQQHSRMEPKS